jgi:acyl-CoA thioesterase-1
LVLGLIAALYAGGHSLHAQDTDAEAKRKPKRKTPPAFQPPQVDENLPNVLLLGDSISIGYMLDVRKQFVGEANVWRPATNCGPTTRGLKSLDDWIGDKKWAVIHFNFGLHDRTTH